MKVKIIKDGKYANQALRAQECKAGAELETGAAYARSLVEDGYAEYVEELPQDEPKKARSKRGANQKERPQAAEPSANPFVG